MGIIQQLVEGYLLSRGSVFVSTGSFRASPAEAVERLLTAGVREIELSGGIPHDGLVDSVLAFGERADLQLHNYFPPADPPFVFNLASSNEGIRRRTLDSMTEAMELSVRIGAQRYSVHAGFLVDPPVAFLGTPWRTLERTDLDVAIRIFVDSVLELKGHADRLGVSLLIENNVLTQGTRDECGEDVLLMASGQQVCDVMRQLPDDVGLLMDVAHLKVTAATLALDASEAMRQTAPFVRGYHLSDNDGLSDSNGPVHAESWFWPHLRRDVSFATLEVAPTEGTDLRSQVDLAEALWSGGGEL